LLERSAIDMVTFDMASAMPVKAVMAGSIGADAR
jgi:hypothetical protein